MGTEQKRTKEFFIPQKTHMWKLKHIVVFAYFFQKPRYAEKSEKLYIVIKIRYNQCSGFLEDMSRRNSSYLQMKKKNGNKKIRFFLHKL
jgi:hypothetical protein